MYCHIGYDKNWRKMRLNILKPLVILIIALGWSLSLCGQNLERAKELYKAGKFAEAKPIFKENIRKNPSNSSLNQWYGVCLFETGDYKDSEKYLKYAASRNILESFRYLGDLYYREYRFEEALEQYNKYLEHLTKKKMNTVEADMRIKNAERAAQMLRRVEEVQIIDSLIVDKADFFKHYKLSPESGTLHDYNTFFNTSSKNNSTVYQNQRGDKIVYGAKTAKSGYDIMTRSRLIDDNWGEEVVLPAPVNSSANQNYPYLLSDGTTLYFASTGEESLGGYDIFVTRLNLNSGNYLVPENIGMPFNSLYNDYMLAIDELNNVGWFVSDRFQPEDKLVIYLFIPNIEKKIYRGGDETRARSLARIDAIKDSWVKGANYKPILEKIYRIGNVGEESMQKGDFMFPVNNRITYTTLEDFDSKEARNLFIKAQDIRKLIRETEDKLQQLRKEYASAQDKKGIGQQISKLEQSLLNLYGQPEELDARSRAEEIAYLIKLQNQKKNK